MSTHPPKRVSREFVVQSWMTAHLGLREYAIIPPQWVLPGLATTCSSPVLSSSYHSGRTCQCQEREELPAPRQAFPGEPGGSARQEDVATAKRRRTPPVTAPPELSAQRRCAAPDAPCFP